MTPIRFHLDEHISLAISTGLSRRGLDVTTTIDAGLSGAKDLDHVAFALAERRVLVTQDDDFLKLHRRGVAHAGIVYGHHGSRTTGEILDFLETLYACSDAPSMMGQNEYM